MCVPCVLAADDSYAFQRAINDAAVWAQQNGKGVAVIIPPGTYEIRQTISIGGSNVVLRGLGVRAGGQLGKWFPTCRACSTTCFQQVPAPL